MRTSSLLFLVLIASCKKGAPPVSAPAPARVAAAPTIAEADVQGLATRLVAVMSPCDPAKVALLLDAERLARRVEERTPVPPDIRAILATAAANKVCAWVSAMDDLRVLRVRTIDGEPRAVLRGVHATGLGYYDVRGVRDATGVRILDVSSHNNGTWLSQEIADVLRVPGTDDPRLAQWVAEINRLTDRGEHVQALATLDAMPASARGTRALQDLRVAIAGRISVDAQRAASDERARRFPDVLPSPFAAMNRAFARGDLDEALRQLDAIEAAVGGDPVIDAIRASVLVRRNQPGDLDDAAARAERAVQAEPRIAMPHSARLGVALAQGRWSTALSTMDTLERDFDQGFPDEHLRTIPDFAGLLATPAYATWRAQHR